MRKHIDITKLIELQVCPRICHTLLVVFQFFLFLNARRFDIQERERKEEEREREDEFCIHVAKEMNFHRFFFPRMERWNRTAAIFRL